MAHACGLANITGNLTLCWLLGLVHCCVDLVDNEIGIQTASNVQLRSQLIHLGACRIRVVGMQGNFALET